MCCERELVGTFETILRPWLAVQQPSSDALQVYREVYADFIKWAKGHGLRTSSDGIVAAAYLVGLGAEGATPDDLRTVADAIYFHHASARRYFDRASPDAVLALSRRSRARAERRINTSTLRLPKGKESP